MWIYEKKLEFPVRVSCKDPRMARNIMTQLGGPDGELSASLRYLHQRYTMPTKIAKALLTDIGTEELAHWEMICTMVHMLTKGATIEEIKHSDMDPIYAIRDKAIYPSDSMGNPWTAAYIQSLGDPTADLHEDMAAEQKARAVYEQLLQLTDDPLLKDGLRFLREREVVHYQRFGEALRNVNEFHNTKKMY